MRIEGHQYPSLFLEGLCNYNMQSYLEYIMEYIKYMFEFKSINWYDLCCLENVVNKLSELNSKRQ